MKLYCFNAASLMLVGAAASAEEINVSQMNIISRFHDDFQRAASIIAPTHHHREVDIKPIHQEVDVKPFHDDHRVLGKGSKKDDDDNNLFVTGIRGKSPKNCNKNVKNLQKELQECEEKLRTSRTTDDLTCHEDLDRCHEDLDACHEEKGPLLLFTQMANLCTFNRKWKGGEYEYTISTTDMDDQTYVFEEIPYRGASVMATTEFFDSFYANFGNDKPNGAITYDDVSTETRERPLIAAFVSAAYYTEDGKFTYVLEQFADQATASISFDELFKTQDSVPYDQCTFFIDNLEGGEDTEGGTDESCDKDGGLWKGVCNATISEGEGSCSVYYGEHTAISAAPNTCPAGEVQKVKPPAWWDYCLSNPANSVSKDVACPGGCGTCKKPDNPTAENPNPTCMCSATSSTPCNTNCGFAGSDKDEGKCKRIPCQQENPSEAGCIELGTNCGGATETKCKDVSTGKIIKCQFPSDYDANSSACSAFCAQIIGTDKCETIRNQQFITADVCPARAISGDCRCASVPDVDVLPKDYYKCKCPNTCPYSAQSIENECLPFSVTGNAKPKVENEDLFNVKIPDIQCPGLKNFDLMGIPAFQTDLRLSGAYNPLSSVTCQNACACNDPNGGLAPPSCAYYNPAVYPGPTDCCYCNGNHIAYDEESFDSCGMFLPIFGPGVLPSQAECYKEYANNDPNSLIDNFPPSSDFYCAKDDSTDDDN